MKYRVFTNDCGPNRSRYSCFSFVSASTDRAALNKAIVQASTFAPVKVVCIPDHLTDILFVSDEPEGGRFRRGVLKKYGATIRKGRS